jgi:hypothetical protein
MDMHAARTSFAIVAGLALAAAPRAAAAADGASGLVTPYGEYALIGGGVADFADSDVRDRFGVGGAWDLRIGLGTRYFVGGELAYVGSARAGEGDGPDLVSNGGEAVLRLQYPYATGSFLVTPFAFGGIGWSRVELQDAGPGLKDADDVGVVPFGAGVTLGYGRLLLDARFTWREAFDEDLPLAAAAEPADLAQWGVTAAVGYEF